MKFCWTLILALGTLCGQVPRVGEINFYGVRKTSEERLRKVLQVQPGDPLPPSRGDMEDRLEKLPGVVLARVEAVCCEGGQVALFVGIEEKGAAHFALRSPPAGSAVLTQDRVAIYRKFLAAVEAAARRGNTAEDLTQGHSLMADPEARAFQEEFASFARDHLPLLRGVLRDSADAEQRAMAASLIAYAPDKTKVVDDLEYAMQDPDEAVRGNAMRSLGAVAVLAARRPSLGIRISPTWFIEMLNSIVLSDRVKAATALVNLTDKDPQKVLDQVRERALPAVLEMAQWKSLKYALPAYILLGRMAGMPEKEIEDAWTEGNRADVVAKVRGGSSSPPR